MRSVLAGLVLPDAARVAALSKGFDADGLADQRHYNSLSPADRLLLHDTFGRPQGAIATGAAMTEQARVAAQALDALAAGGESWTGGIVRRDAAMAENMLELIAAEPARKFMVLSHDMHIRADAAGGRTMGTRLREALGQDYFAIGSTFRRAAFDPPIYGVGHADADSDTVEALVGNETPLALGLRGAAEGAAKGPVDLQAVVPGAVSRTHYAAIAEAFDMLLLVPALSNAEQLIEADLSLEVPRPDAQSLRA
jgi:erythromycin esterase-like protein